MAAGKRGAFRTGGLFWTCEDEVKEKGTNGYAVRAYELSAYSFQLSAFSPKETLMSILTYRGHGRSRPWSQLRCPE